MANACCYAALYTRHLTQKRKVYHDGFVLLRADGSAASLVDEGGQTLAPATPLVPGAPRWEPDAEGLTLFDGFLVNLDGPGVPPGTEGTEGAAPGGGESRGDSGGGGGYPAAPVRRPPALRKRRADWSEARNAQAARTTGGPALCTEDATVAGVGWSRQGHRLRTDDEIMDILRHGYRPPGAGAPSEESDRHAAPATARWSSHPSSTPPWAAQKGHTQAAQGGTAPQRRSDSAVAGSRPSAPLHPCARRPAARDSPATLRFPSQAEVAAPARRQAVPDAFDSWGQYAAAWADALHEELNLRAHEVARQLYQALPADAAGTRSLARDITATPSPATDPGALAALLARKLPGVYYPVCALAVKERRWQGGAQRRGMHEDDMPAGAPKKQVFLALKAGVRPSSHYRQDDLWFLCPNAGYSQGAPASRASPKVIVARSMWHGPDRDGRMEVEPLNIPAAQLPTSQRVYALQGVNAATEFLAIQLLQQQAPESAADHPLLRALLRRPEAPPTSAGDAATGCPVGALAESVASQFELNPEQSAAISSSVAPWFLDDRQPSQDCAGDPVCLVHGPFGTGKSSLLIAMIHFISAAMQGAEEKPRAAPGGKPPKRQILVSAHTNVAVDRVLAGLVASGFTDVMRVGSLKRITDKSLLKYSLHCSDGRRNTEAVEELKQMLAEAAPGDAELIRSEIAAMQAGAEKDRKLALKAARVVGVTCCSATLPALKDRHFEVLILDEASQMVEPLSLLPVLVSKCRYLVAAGDPCQLPPVIASPAATPRGSHGLARPLFVRLQALGRKSHLLRRQYRCHPDIAHIPNQQFYQGRLLHGCSPEQRPALLPGLHPLSFIDVDGAEQRQGNSGSVSNREEALMVAKVARLLVGGGVPAEDIGVICFFRAQVHAVTRLLTKPGAQPLSITVATVDSFQGMEKAVIILSTAVTRPGSGFTADVHRLNVAFTRARSHMLVVGCAGALGQSCAAFHDLLSACGRVPGGVCRHGRPPEALLRASAAAAVEAAA
eukprot:jgi/Tetstr1/423749/TSEL_014381.t2